MPSSSLAPELQEQISKIVVASKKKILKVEDCAKCCDCNPSKIYRAIRSGELPAVGRQSKQISSIALAKWLLGY